MFKKILVANRGEIAVRIISTCKILDIHAIAIYSEVDAESPHVMEADEAHCVGEAQVSESYLNIDKIIDIAKKSGADAIHPGYGFLSENAHFAKKSKNEGIVFIGPAPETMAQMGDKVLARKRMKEVGVPVIPGSDDPIADAEKAVSFADDIGYPVMLKAAAGGGGIGMEKVNDADALKKAFHSNQRRAENYFGSGSLYIEKALEVPRHIEVQVLGDQHGHVIHLGERDCSIQRRHQKVFEEAPAIGLSDELLSRLHEAAVQAAKSLKYENAGTLEFLVEDDEFYFLEMNTRLQVEHPVTEWVTGVDIVQEQLKVAAGEKLSVEQPQIKIKGHSIETRIYAEDPKTFFPSPGTIDDFHVPESEYIRLDTGVRSGTEITPHYDPLLAKLIVYGKSREEAIDRLEKTLDECDIRGLKTNLSFLREVSKHPEYTAGNVTIHFINEHF
ncbi:acetyl-CoA carboxylase biotin carboxylase subunit [Salicibibacter cibarius]|uniref:biotin carboxylase n=1 Tax=Salicibibacter cibarius TaxID=2743000 RepID=A0A7T6Z7I1_9BACI|nr:acetyl-CoA carboxylase biotin carboxylase subunit [Salicibibacter cibarius]QQK77801.1 acetyl-CoA carboxylase biotin carboxylase subunit [Salicibibacter cibarius]